MRRRTMLVVALLAWAGQAGAQQVPPPRRRPVRRAPPPAASAEASVRASPPAIDLPAVQPIGPGPQPAPVPYANAQPPLADRHPRATLSFGVPSPPLFGQGETFQRADSMNETRTPAGLRLPSPGATLRLPVW